MSSRSLFLAVLLREFKISLTQKTDIATIFFFFLIVASLFPFAVGPDTGSLRTVGPGVVWVAALLSSLLALHRMFEGDFIDGSLEQFLLSGEPLVLIVVSKIFAHWLFTTLPIVILSPFVGMQFGISSEASWIMALTLLIGTPVLSLMGSVGAALTLGVRSGAALTALLILPLYIPVLIFGVGGTVASSQGMEIIGHFSILLAFLCLSLALCPLATSAAVKIALE